MVQQSLVEYCQRLLQQGYDAGVIRTTLLNAGYSPYDVDAALRASGAPSGRKISTKPLLIAFVIILFASAGLLIALKFLQAPPVVLDMSVSLFSSQFSPGQDVVVNIELRNPRGKQTNGLIDVVVSGPSGKVASKTESFSVSNVASIPVSIPLPSSAVEGSYEIAVKVSYKGKQAVESKIFEVKSEIERAVLPSEVLEEKAEVEAREIQLTCPGGCDDLNFCTRDECVQGECMNTPVVPCCGNAQCESGESRSSCALDCSERYVSPDEVKARAKELASSDVVAAIETCDSIAQRAYIDACLDDVAVVSENKDACLNIVDSDIRDGCLMTFAYKNDFSVCSDIKNEYIRNSCNSLAGVGSVTPPS